VGRPGPGGPVLSTTAAKGETTIQEPTAAERAIARRAAESRATVPDLELGADVDMAACLELSAAHGWPLTAMLARTCALALRAVPRANGAYRDGRYELYSRVNVGIALATEDAYLIPTVFDADRKRLPELSAEVEQLTVAALAGELSPPAFSGATFTLSHPGELGVAFSSVVVNTPQAAALAAGSIRRVPVIRDGAVIPGDVMTVTVACDHRILYGAHAARFLREICARLSEGKL
jgi:pyruvate dehydrogenase E2 component (dihydrolipoamide acetyltransferase)